MFKRKKPPAPSQGKKPPVPSKGKKLPAPSQHSERNVVIQVPPRTSKKVLEKLISDALGEKPLEAIRMNRSRELIIAIAEMGDDWERGTLESKPKRSS
jgi:hypothetical protein